MNSNLEWIFSDWTTNKQKMLNKAYHFNWKTKYIWFIYILTLYSSILYRIVNSFLFVCVFVLTKLRWNWKWNKQNKQSKNIQDHWNSWYISNYDKVKFVFNAFYFIFYSHSCAYVAKEILFFFSNHKNISIEWRPNGWKKKLSIYSRSIFSRNTFSAQLQ